MLPIGGAGVDQQERGHGRRKTHYRDDRTQGIDADRSRGGGRARQDDVPLDREDAEVAKVMRTYKVISPDVLDWDLIDSIVETERNLPDVMEYDAAYREAIWEKYPPADDRFQDLRYWWGLKKSELHDYYEGPGWDARIALKTKDTPATENYAFAFVRCLIVRPEIRSWLPIELDLTARKYFEGSPEGVAAHRKYGDKAGLGKEYWLGKYRMMSYVGYLTLRYAPHIVPASAARADYDMISSAVGLFLYANDIDAANERHDLFEILKYLPAEDYLIGAYFPEQYERFYGDKS